MSSSSMSPYKTPSGFLLPSIHAAPPFFTQQLNPTTQATLTAQWTRLILSYARHRQLFLLRVEDAGIPGSDWDEIFRNERINRKLLPSHLSAIFADMVSKNLAVYEPVKQTSSVLLYWRTPDEWAEVLHSWAESTGQLQTILTFYDIVEPPVPSPLTGLPISILRKAISILAKTSRSQTIAVADGEGVRFLPGNTSKG
ncbi:ESCRT-II complex vps25 subunit [Cytidiella melzeri]|nr:ESCRT-II complex vps25 subunit [Cytidiella melzeri]